MKHLVVGSNSIGETVSVVVGEKYIPEGLDIYLEREYDITMPYVTITEDYQIEELEKAIREYKIS